MDPREYIGFQELEAIKGISVGIRQEKHSKGSNFEAAGNNTESINAKTTGNNLMEARGQGKPRVLKPHSHIE